MKYKVYLILFFIILFNCEEIFPIENLSKAFYLDEESIIEYNFFCENGVKCNYTTCEKAEEEINRIKSLIIKYKNLDYIKTSKNYLEAKGDNKEIYIYTYNNKIGCKVEIKIVNYEKRNNVNKLMNNLIKLQNSAAKNIRYFSYIKGKVSNIEETIKEIKNNKDLKDIKTVNINNGYTGTAKYKNEKINFAINNYDTGSYIIIGTPIIFTTY